MGVSALSVGLATGPVALVGLLFSSISRRLLVGGQAGGAAFQGAVRHSASGGDSAGLTCPLCPQEIWAGMYPPHTKGPRETKISLRHRGKLAFWTKSSRPGHVSKKIKKDTACA